MFGTLQHFQNFQSGKKSRDFWFGNRWTEFFRKQSPMYASMKNTLLGEGIFAKLPLGTWAAWDACLDECKGSLNKYVSQEIKISSQNQRPPYISCTAPLALPFEPGHIQHILQEIMGWPEMHFSVNQGLEGRSMYTPSSRAWGFLEKMAKNQVLDLNYLANLSQS